MHLLTAALVVSLVAAAALVLHVAFLLVVRVLVRLLCGCGGLLRGLLRSLGCLLGGKLGLLSRDRCGLLSSFLSIRRLLVRDGGRRCIRAEYREAGGNFSFDDASDDRVTASGRGRVGEYRRDRQDRADSSGGRSHSGLDQVAFWHVCLLG